MVEKSSDDFNEFAADYRNLHNENIKITGADSDYFALNKVTEINKFESNLPLKFLDVGCGDGTVELFVQRLFPLWKCTGIDISENSIEEAQKKKIPNAEFVMYNGLDFPIADSEFEIVFLASVLHHVPESLQQKIINEACRVLKRGGRIYLFEHNPINPFTRYLVRTCVFDKNAKLLTYKYARGLLINAGFSSIIRKFILFFPRSGLFEKFHFLEKKLTWLPIGGQYFYRAVK